MTDFRLADIDVPRIGLGTNRLTTARAGFVREAVAAGVRHIDTAHLYTDGESERATRRRRSRRASGRSSPMSTAATSATSGCPR